MTRTVGAGPTTSPPRDRPDSGVRKRSGIRQPFEHVLLLLLAVLLLAPFLWFVSVAFRPEQDLYQLLPSRLTLENFPAMLDRVPAMASYYADSFVITGVSIAIIVIASTMGGYAFARLPFRGRDKVFWIVVSTIFVPHATAVATLYLELVDFQLLDTRLGLILVYAAWQVAIGTLIMRSVFAQIPDELEQAARIDGASTWQILWRIYVPLAKGGVIVVCLISFVYIWGEYLFAFTFAGDEVIPMSLGIRFFQPTASDPTYTFNVAAAAGLVMFIPSLVIYLVFQKWFSRGVLEGALKG